MTSHMGKTLVTFQIKYFRKEVKSPPSTIAVFYIFFTKSHVHTHTQIIDYFPMLQQDLEFFQMWAHLMHATTIVKND